MQLHKGRLLVLCKVLLLCSLQVKIKQHSKHIISSNYWICVYDELLLKCIVSSINSLYIVFCNVILAVIVQCGHSCKNVSNWHPFFMNSGITQFLWLLGLFSVIRNLASIFPGVNTAPLLPLASLRVVSSYLAKQYSSTWTLLLCMYAHVVWHDK